MQIKQVAGSLGIKEVNTTSRGSVDNNLHYISRKIHVIVLYNSQRIYPMCLNNNAQSNL